MLGCLQMDVQTCIDKYAQIMDHVFESPRIMPVNITNGELVPKYKQSRLKARILEVIGEARVTQGTPPDRVRMRTDMPSRCKVQVLLPYF